MLPNWVLVALRRMLLWLLLLGRSCGYDYANCRIAAAAACLLRGLRVQVLRQVAATAAHDRTHWNETAAGRGGVVLQ